MQSSENQNPRPSRPLGRIVAVATVALAFAFAASLTALALASTGAPTVRAAHNAKLGKIVVDAHGRTLYVLTPETAHHLLCKTRECFAAWPPLTVPSRKTKLKKGAGVRGRLTILRRSDGMLQVVLNGMPLYRFAGDSRKGEAKGQHIHSFGGVWHVVPAAHRSKSMSSSGTSTTSSTGTAMTTSTGWPASTSSSPAGSTTTSTLSTTTSTTSTMPSTSTTVTKSTTSCLYPPCY